MLDGYSFHKGRIVSDGKDVSIFQLNKQEVTSLQFDRLLKEIKSVENNSTKGFSSIALTIDGYNDVVEELYELPHVRRYFNRLIKKLPHFLYYVNPFTRMPPQIIGALSDYTKVAFGVLETPAAVLKRDGNLDNVGKHSVSFSLPPDIGYKMIDAIVAHADKVEFKDKDNELPILLRLIEQSIPKKDHR
ncbi:hypothetical protein D1B31_18100 [Neobacillus notoginsengisoli]|uniref:Uncharacterized protein n=1 Tax=Neobacillus notoginsengisoli TaxID=1578198 RepID=A0A417YQI1_9BACI|nr:hypothetical protein [Neobacillus notoginsengisoli]RHW36001.1 hypothetical protein D1B31_18100 [Neobacillus notoginsengisoli]